MKKITSMCLAIIFLWTCTLSVFAEEQIDDNELIAQYESRVTQLEENYDVDLNIADSSYKLLVQSNITPEELYAALNESILEKGISEDEITYEEVSNGEKYEEAIMTRSGVMKKNYVANHAQGKVWAGIPALGTGSILIDFSYNITRTYTDSLSVNNYTINSANVNYSVIDGLLMATWEYRRAKIYGEYKSNGGYNLKVQVFGTITYGISISIEGISFPVGYSKEMGFTHTHSIV